MGSLQNMKYPSSTLSSLAGLVSNTPSVISNSKISSQHNANSQSFGSLAALTAHHLQKSNTNDVKFSEREQSSNLFDKQKQFLIPKLSIKDDKNDDFKNRELLKSHNNDDSKSIYTTKQLIFADSINKHKSIDLQTKFSNMHILSNSDTEVDVNLEKQLEKSINVVNEVRTTSPENWIIDLSTALKEAELLTESSFNSINSTSLKKSYYNTPNLEIDDKDEISNVLPVTLNLYALRRVQLPYTKKKVSLFGRTLCKKWKTRKPNLKLSVYYLDTNVKRFDFSTPYSQKNR